MSGRGSHPQPQVLRGTLVIAPAIDQVTRPDSDLRASTATTRLEMQGTS